LKLKLYIVFIFIICPYFIIGQIIDSSSQRAIPEIEISDSIQISTQNNSQTQPSLPLQKEPVRVSPDAFDANIDFGSKDTMWFDHKHNTVHLYGSAYVKYDNLNLKAGYITFNFDKNEALAQALTDTLGNEIELPTFEDGNQTFNARKLRYNFKSRKGMVYDAIKKEGDLFIHGAVTKYISKEADTINHVETIYARDGIITSCDANHPHFGVRSQKIKIVPNKLAVLGFSVLEIADIPTPLVLPFGFYPMFKNQRSGIILPKNYTFNKSLGYGFSGIGFYFPINDYYDIKLTGDIYTRGSWGLQVNSNYRKRYKFNGNVALSYFNARAEQAGTLDKSSSHKFSIRMVHNQDPKAHPYQKFGGSIALTLNGFDKAFNTDAATRLNNTTRSNFSYENKLPSSIFSFDTGLEHSQNTQSGKISITFPVARLRMNAYYPFKSKKGVGKPKWYEKININYNADAKNLIEATDSTLLDAKTLENAKYGMKHNASSNASFKVMKYFSLNPSVSYNEIYFTKMRDISFDPNTVLDTLDKDHDGFADTDYDGNILYDTIYGRTTIDTFNTFKPYREFNSSISLSTKQYGKILFNKGWLRGIRHVISYNVGFNYKPGTKQFYEVEIDEDARDDYEDYNSYNVFVQGPYGQGNPSITQMALRYSIGNIIEAKYFSKADSISKKVNVLKSLNITGNYNFAADSLQFSPINLNASASFFKNLISIKYTGTLDPYVENNNRRINRLVWDEKKIPLRHERSTININSGFTIRQLTELFNTEKKGDKGQNAETAVLKKESSLLEILGTFRIRYDVGMTWQQDNGVDTFYINRHTLSTQGNIKLTENWNIRIGHIGYDFKGKGITYPDLGFERNLHCWTMNFSWRPRAGQYSFFIGVRSTTLDFLKYNHGQSPLESSYGGAF
jgi:hypothetical protein